MACERAGGRQPVAELRVVEGWGVSGARPEGGCAPDGLDGLYQVWGDPTHPARLRPSDLEHPEGFHARLNRWLLQQG